MQATIGCSWNHCTYCDMYRDKEFPVRPLAETLSDLRAAAASELREAGLTLLYIGPESGDDPTLKRITKGASFAEHVEAARRAHAAGMALSAIFLLGVAGTERSAEHAEGSARLITEMDPGYVSALTLTVVPETPLGGRLPQDRDRIVSVIDQALAGRVGLRPEWARGL